MDQYAVEQSSLTKVANAIRGMGGTEDPLEFPDGFVNAIYNLEGGGGVGLQMELLWENASPTSEFAAQTIPLDLSDFDMAAVTFQFTDSWVMTRTEFAYMDVASCMCEHWREGVDYSRNFLWHSEGVRFAEGYMGTAVNNQYCIPLRIYGIKGVIE